MVQRACCALVLAVMTTGAMVSTLCRAEDDDPALALMGNYEGESATGNRLAIKVVAYDDDRFMAVIQCAGLVSSVDGELSGHTVRFKGNTSFGAIRADIKNGIFEGKLGTLRAFRLKRIEIKPPSLGEAPPQGAVVLFDGKNLDAWNPTEKPWSIVPDGVLEVGKGNLVSKQEFGNFKLHIEFRVPFMKDKVDLERGNSGIYLQGRYEIQLLDSFGLEMKGDECGAISKKATPKLNACLPPTEWQTYDITFVAPVIDAAGAKTKNAQITVIQNGNTIHNNVDVNGPTEGGVADKEAKTGPLMLQDRGCPVQFRNIWLVPGP